jgi:hypothetical protein
MLLKTFITDIIHLLCLTLLDFMRSVPRTANRDLLKTYWKIYFNYYWNIDINNSHRKKSFDVQEKKFENFTRDALLDLYHKMILTIWKLYWLSPSTHLVKYNIDSYQINNGESIVMIPYVNNLQFNYANHVYHFVYRNVSYANQNQRERAMKVIEGLCDYFDYPNTSIIFIMDPEVIQELNLKEEFPNALFDTFELKMFTDYHKCISSIVNGHSKKIYCNDDIPGSFITYWTFDWIFNKLIKKINNNIFYIEKSSFNHFNDRMNENFADNLEIMRWNKIKSIFQTFDIDNLKLEYYDYQNGGNIYKCTEECLRNEGIYMFSYGSKHIYNFLTGNQCVQLPLTIFPSKGCLKGSREDKFHFGIMPFYKRWFKILSHNIRLFMFIYID